MIRPARPEVELQSALPEAVRVGPALPRRAALSIGLVLLACAGLQAQPAPIVVGISAPLSGPGAAYGRGLQHGIQLAIARANETGGIEGRRLELLALDDRGDAAQAAANARELMRRGVVAMTGVHGAAAAAAVAEVLAGAGQATLPLVAPATGAEGLREPPRPGVFHLRAGTFDEMNAAMLHLDTVGLTRYALVIQDGAFGDSARSSLELQLVRIGLRPVASRQLAQPTQARATMAALCAARPQVVVLALNEALALAAIEAGRSLSCATQYLVFSETGAALAARGGSAAMAGLLVTQIVPHPGNLSHPLIAEYQRALAAQGDALAAGYPSVEGYQAMRVLLEALRACPHEPGRPCLLQALANRSFDVAGQRIQFGSQQRQPRPYVEMTLLDAQGRFRR